MCRGDGGSDTFCMSKSGTEDLAHFFIGEIGELALHVDGTGAEAYRDVEGCINWSV